MISVDTLQYNELPAVERKAMLTLLPLKADRELESLVARETARRAALARARYSLGRAAREFMDRVGFVELDAAPDPALSSALGQVCWNMPAGRGMAALAGQIGGAERLEDSIDLLERVLANVLQGLIARSRADLLALGVDIDMLKYVRLPVRRLSLDEVAGSHEEALLREYGEPLFISFYAAPDSTLAWCRLLLPGVGLVASGNGHGRFTIDHERLAGFALMPRLAKLARPELREEL